METKIDFNKKLSKKEKELLCENLRKYIVNKIVYGNDFINNDNEDLQKILDIFNEKTGAGFGFFESLYKACRCYYLYSKNEYIKEFALYVFCDATRNFADDVINTVFEIKD